MKRQKSSRSFGMYGVVMTACVLLIVIAVNLLFSLLPDSVKRIDVSSEQLTEVSGDAKKYLKTVLDSDVSLYLIAESGMENVYISEYLTHLTEANKHVSFEKIDHTVKRAFTESLTGQSPDSLSDNTVVIKGEKYKTVKIISPENLYSYEMFRIDPDLGKFVSYGEYSYREFLSVYEANSEDFNNGYANYTEKFSGETTLISAIDYVLTDPSKMPKICFTSMHGEGGLSNSGTLVQMLEVSNLPYSQITLTEEIPSDTGVVVMNAPMSDITKDEAEHLEDYLSGGGKLFLTTAYSSVKKLENLMNILKKYGLSPEENELHESNSSYYYPGYSHYLLPDTSVLEQLYGVEHYYFLGSSAHAIKTDSETENITYTHLLKTSTGAYYETDESGTKSEGMQYCIAASARVKEGGEIVWFASPNILSEEDSSLTGDGNYVYFTSILSALCEKNNVSFKTKILDSDTLTISAGQASFWAVILIAIIPLIFITVGFFSVRRRRRA